MVMELTETEARENDLTIIEFPDDDQTTIQNFDQIPLDDDDEYDDEDWGDDEWDEYWDDEFDNVPFD